MYCNVSNHTNFYWNKYFKYCRSSEIRIHHKGGSRHKNWCIARVLSFLIKYFSNYYTLHRSDLAARAAPLDPRLNDLSDDIILIGWGAYNQSKYLTLYPRDITRSVQSDSTHQSIHNSLLNLRQRIYCIMKYKLFMILYILDFNDPATPKNKQNTQFSFSPGQHAEKLRLLKQSPAAGYMHKTRLMFKSNDENENVRSTVFQWNEQFWMFEFWRFFFLHPWYVNNIYTF